MHGRIALSNSPRAGPMEALAEAAEEADGMLRLRALAIIHHTPPRRARSDDALRES